MSSEEQASAYLEEAELTLESAEAIYDSAKKSDEDLWAQVVKCLGVKPRGFLFPRRTFQSPRGNPQGVQSPQA